MARPLEEVARLDGRWFRAHPERRHRCRWPYTGELELIRSARGARLVMAIHHLGRGHVVYQPVIFDGALPADEKSAAALFGLAVRHPKPIPVVAEMDVLQLTSWLAPAGATSWDSPPGWLQNCLHIHQGEGWRGNWPPLVGSGGTR
jgi:hypothetical protein